MDAVKWKPSALHFRHKLSKLIFIVDIVDALALDIKLVHHVIDRLLLKHILAKELDDLRFETREFAGPLYHLIS